ncbi:MAG TPA: DUF4411 family protein [Smithella sp.]|nr:DUF4411 family protein [Smithella sp.]
MAQKKKEEIFCFDSSSFIILHRYYGEDLIPDIWIELERYFNDDQIISHEVVFEELTTSTKKDALSKWASSKKRNFKKMTSNQAIYVSDIIKSFPGLIDAKSEKDQADPWLIALVLEEKSKHGLFISEKEYFIVSEEKIGSPHKIPAVCEHFGINHLSLRDFFRYNNWQLGMRKK